jgi:Mat/Ecp fimbriae major subunit
MRFSTRVSAAMVVAFSLAATAASAQSATIQALANVYQPITVTGARDLDFGNVFPGIAKSIAIADPTSGRFDLAGQASANVDLTFSLPATLAGPAASTMPIGSWTGCYNATNATAGCTTFTPSGSATATSFSGAGALYVWVGGQVTPAANQTAGSYSGTVQLSAVYF